MLNFSLARTIYKKADIYLFDDPLSSVDSNVGRHLFNECIGPRSRLAGTTRILVTHQVDYLKEADWIILLRDVRQGETLSMHFIRIELIFRVKLKLKENQIPFLTLTIQGNRQ